MARASSFAIAVVYLFTTSSSGAKGGAAAAKLPIPNLQRDRYPPRPPGRLRANSYPSPDTVRPSRVQAIDRSRGFYRFYGVHNHSLIHSKERERERGRERSAGCMSRGINPSFGGCWKRDGRRDGGTDGGTEGRRVEQNIGHLPHTPCLPDPSRSLHPFCSCSIMSGVDAGWLKSRTSKSRRGRGERSWGWTYRMMLIMLLLSIHSRWPDATCIHSFEFRPAGSDLPPARSRPFYDLKLGF